ncbi:MAG: multicopper oxidase domain-containing protein, partial [Acidobacteriaceae bacterium]
MKAKLSRRDFLRAGGLAILGSAGTVAIPKLKHPVQAAKPMQMESDHLVGMPTVVGEVNHARNGFNPSDVLTDFDYGQVSTLPDGRTLREYNVQASEGEVEIVPGLMFPAWTYNNRIPGPTIRATEGDLIRIHFTNGSSHPHSMHFHGIHSSVMDGVPGTPGAIDTGGSFTYEFTAEPYGVHL